jgi:hypothetical protein
MPRLQAKNLFGDSRLIEKAFLAERVPLKETSQLGKPVPYPSVTSPGATTCSSAVPDPWYPQEVMNFAKAL